jgi:hypothetical protein
MRLFGISKNDPFVRRSDSKNPSATTDLMVVVSVLAAEYEIHFGRLLILVLRACSFWSDRPTCEMDVV